MKVSALTRVGRNVSHLESAAAFYHKAFGFQPAGPKTDDPALATALGVEKLRWLRMSLGAQEIELSECFPKIAAYPYDARANDLAFHHIAIVTTDIAAAARQALRHGARAISRTVPVRLPASSGGVTAFKCRDPDGHPVELLQFPENTPHAKTGFDHSAISISNLEKSIAFYSELGLSIGARQVNRGPEQDALDGLTDVTVDVVAMRPARPVPHVELLGYRAPLARPPAPYPPPDIRASRLVFKAAGGGLTLVRDPDGHVTLIDGR